MNELLTLLNSALQGSTSLGLTAAAALGVASVLLSPCHLASVPLVIAVVGAREGAGPSAAAISLRFGLGVVAAFAGVGLVTVTLGRIAGDVGPVGVWLGAALLILFGLEALEVLHLPWLWPATAHPRVRSAHPAVIGLLFGATLGPCTFAFMAPALGVAFALASTRPLYASVLLGAFTIAHVSVLVVAGLFGDATMRFLGDRGATRAVAALRAAMGVLLILAGIALVASAR